MRDEIIKVLNNLCEKFGLAIDRSSENVLPYMKELCQKCASYECNTSIMWLIIGIIFILLGAAFAFYSYVGDDDDLCVLALFAAIFLISIGFIITICQILDIIACNTFPEKILIQYIKNMCNS